MGPLLQVILKEFLQLRQDRKIIPALVMGPLIQLIALGYAANLDVTHVPLLLVDRDQSIVSDRSRQRAQARVSGVLSTKRRAASSAG